MCWNLFFLWQYIAPFKRHIIKNFNFNIFKDELSFDFLLFHFRAFVVKICGEEQKKKLETEVVETSSEEEGDDDDVFAENPSQNRKRNIHKSYAEASSSEVKNKKKKTATVKPLLIGDDDSD